MISKDFLVDYNFNKREFKTKLKILMKCRTVSEVNINKEEGTFTFKKSHRAGNRLMHDPQEHFGRFEVIVTENPEIVVLKLSI